MLLASHRAAAYARRMPKKLNGEPLVPVTLRITKQQAKDFDLLARQGRIASARTEVMMFLLGHALTQLQRDGVLGPVRRS